MSKQKNNTVNLRKYLEKLNKLNVMGMTLRNHDTMNDIN